MHLVVDKKGVTRAICRNPGPSTFFSTVCILLNRANIYVRSLLHFLSNVNTSHIASQGA